LIILAPHRLVRGIPKPTIDEFFTKLRSLFQIEEMPLKTPDIWLRLEDTLSHSSKIRIVLFGTDTDNVHILTLQDQEAVSEMIPYFHSELYKGLDVSIVDHVILENLLALSSEKEKTGLAYSYDMADAVGKVLTQEYQLAILLSPVRPEMIKMIADAGDKMPRKSTYFYPKSPSGLIVHRLDRA
jgi:sugar diacid utilization regulator